MHITPVAGLLPWLRRHHVQHPQLRMPIRTTRRAMSPIRYERRSVPHQTDLVRPLADEKPIPVVDTPRRRTREDGQLHPGQEGPAYNVGSVGIARFPRSPTAPMRWDPITS